MDWYSRSLVASAPWSYVVLFGACMLLAMLIERTVFLMFRAGLNAEKLLETLRKLVVADNRDRALKLLVAAGDVPITRVCRAGLQAFDRKPFELEKVLDEAVAKELPQLRRRLPQIFLLSAGVALVGVLGSVMLGATFDLGGKGPLPFGLALLDAPALAGGVSGLVGALGGIFLVVKSQQITAALEQSKQAIVELSYQRSQ